MEQKKEPRPKNQLKTWVQFTNIGLQMAIVIVAGTYLGVWLDTKYPNAYSGFTVACSLLAVGAAMYNVFRQLNNMNRKK